MSEFDRITYSESRTINTGNYEKQEAFFSFSSTVTPINFLENKMTVQHSESTNLPVNLSKEEFSKAASKVMNRVKAVLDEREKQIRTASYPFVDYPTLEKVGLKKPKKKKDEDDFLTEDDN
jgi:hypothetical protein